MSKPMPSDPGKKTKSARRRNPLGLWLGAALIIFGLFAVINGLISLTDNKTRLLAPEGIFTVEKAETPEERIKGLSDREKLADNEGLLFVFDSSSLDHCFWMKDMRFAIDMIWLDENKKVVTVTQNVTPDTFPESFCPSEPAKYGLEIPAGRAQETGITPAAQLRF